MFFNLFKKKTKVLFYGSNGWIGGLFMDHIKKNYPDLEIILGTSRIDNYQDTLIEIKVNNPTHIISFTGKTRGVIDGNNINTIDYLEYPGKLKENIENNLYGPLNLAIICKKNKIHYTYLGTGCIFDGPGIYEPGDKPNFFGSQYSVVKGITDRIMHSYPVLNLRIRMPVSSIPHPSNFITKILNYTNICSIQNSMTVLDDFWDIFIDLLLKNKTGTYNCTNPGTIEHSEILINFPDKVWTPMTIDEQAKLLKCARSNNHLSTIELSKEYPKLKGIQESIKDIIFKYKS